MELMRIDSFLFKAIYLVEAGIVITQVLNLDGLTSLLFLMTFPITVLLWIRTVRKTAMGTDLLMGIAVALAVIGVFINASICGASIGFQYLKKLIMFIMTLLFLQTAHRTRCNKDLANFFNLIVDLLTLFLIAMYLTQGKQMFILNGRITMYLTFRFSNPNMTALLLSCLFMFKMHRMFVPEKWYIKILHGVMILFLAWFILLTQSRNSMLAMALFTAIVVWQVFKKKKNLTIRKVWAVVVAVFPGAFVIAYMLLVTNPWIQKTLSFLVSEGKSLNSRVDIWTPALKNLWNSPFVGAYYQISGGTGSSQMHNNHLDIAASYGLPVLILVCILLTMYIYQRGRRYTQKGNYIYMLGFCCAILLGIGEAAVFAGGIGIYILVGSFLLLANLEENEIALR